MVLITCALLSILHILLYFHEMLFNENSGQSPNIKTVLCDCGLQ